MGPVVISALKPFLRRRRLCGIAREPRAHVVVVELLRPKHAGKALAHDVATVRRHRLRNDVAIELVGIQDSFVENLIECLPEMILHAVDVFGKYQLDDRALARRDLQVVIRRCLGPGLLCVDAIALRLHHVIVDAVFLIKAGIGRVEQTPQIALVFREQKLWRSLGEEPALAVLGMVDAH